MKHLKHLFTALLMLCATAVAAHDFEVGGIYYNILSGVDKTVEVTYRGTSYNDYKEYTGSVVIPQSVTYNGSTYSVTSIGSSAFYNCDGLTSVVIPNSVTSIGKSAFAGTAWYNNQPDGVVYAGKVLYKYKGTMSSNTSIAIKDGTLGIGSYAFRDCSALTSVEIPNSVTSIGSYAFYNCDGLTSVVIPNSVTSIGESAFTGTAWYNNQPDGVVYAGKVLYKYKGTMSSNTSIAIKDGTLGIGSYAFYNCSALTSVEIPNSVTSIGYAAFSYCSGLTSVVIPNSVTSIGSYAFYNCSALTSVVIPNSVTSIGERAFGGCSALTSVVIPNSVISIGSYAFLDCSGLTSVVIPNSVTSIGGDAFRNCSTLTSVEIPNSVTSIDDGAFYNCSGLTSVVIPNSVISIGEDAFYNCSGLTSIEIPNSVTSIGGRAFDECWRLKKVINFSSLKFSKGSAGYGYVAYYADTVINAPNGSVEGDFVFGVINGVNTLCGYIGAGGDVTLPADYKGENYAIGADVFKNNTSLTSIEIPNSVTSIGDGAFSGCSGLKEVHISDLSAWCNIAFASVDANPLYYAHNLYLNGELVTDLVIPNSVTSIGKSAFRDCSGLTSIEIPNSVTSIGGDAFYGCNGLKKVINFSSLTFSKGSTANGYVAYYADTVINVPNGFVEGDFIFAVIDGVNTLCAYIDAGGDVTLPADYKGENYAIGADVFKNNTSLTSVVIPNSVISIGDGAFSGCTALTSIEILDGVAGIGEEAFRGCSDLEYIYISSTIESIGDYAFAECNNIFDIKIGSKKAVAASENVFSSDAYNNACLYVPAGRKDFYAKTSPWSNFVIQETDFTGIDEVKGENGKVKDVYYDLNGRAVESPANGLYIKNGKKVFVK